MFLVKHRRSSTLSHRQERYGTETKGASSAPPGIDIYGVDTSSRIDIHETADPGGNINAVQKSNTIIPPIVQTSSALPYISPMESALSSVFVKLSSPALDDGKRKTTKGKKRRTHIPSSPKTSPAPPIKKHTRGAKPPQPSKALKKKKIRPIVTNDAVPSVSNIPTTDTVVERFDKATEAADAGTDIAGSDLVPVNILRRTAPQMSDIPGNRRRSTNYHPNIPRYSIDYSAPDGPNNLQKLPPLPAHPKASSEPIMQSASKPKKKK